MPTAKADLYLDENGKATTKETDTPYLKVGAVISDKEARRVGLKSAEKEVGTIVTEEEIIAPVEAKKKTK